MLESSATRNLLGTSPGPFVVPAENSTELWQRLEARRPSPLRFVLHLSRRHNAALCPCFEAEIPSLTSPSTSFTVTRILDPEHRVPYVTLSPMFHAAGLTLIQGLLRCNLSLSSFDVSLAGLEPWDDLWISLPLARSIASRLELSSALASILESKSAPAWSLDEFNQGLSHNWRVPQEYVDAAAYSTDAIMDNTLRFDRAQMLPQGQQITTLISKQLRSNIVHNARETWRSERFKLHQNLVRWSSQLYSIFLDVEPLLKVDQGDVQKELILKSILNDLRDVVVSPTETDLLEWLQFTYHSSPTSVSAHRMTSRSQHGSDEGRILSYLNSMELSELRRKEATLGDILLSTERGDDADQIVGRLDSIMRAKMSCLHHLNLISLARMPSLSETQMDSQLDIGGTSTGMVMHQHSADDGNVQNIATTATAAAAGSGEEIAQLHVKIDLLASKLDALLASSSCSSSHDLAKDPQIIPKSTVSLKHLASPDQHTYNSKRSVLPILDELPRSLTLTRVETNPSLVIAIVSAFLFFVLIQSSCA